jgi:sugar lactone lactonase YvrE
VRATQLTEPLAYHAEGPVWVTGTRWPDGLYWVDMLAGDVLHLQPSGVVTRRHINAIAAVIRPRTNGGLVYAIERGFAMDDGPDTPLRLLPDLWRDPSLRMNEGGCDPAGAFYCGSMTYQGEAGRGTLYRLDPDGTVTPVETGFAIPNGLDWVPSGERAYHVDTPTHRIDVLDWDPAQGLHNRRPFVSIDGDPDGLCLDAEGGVWVALYGGSAVHRYAADGTLSEVVELPVSQITACTFGGPDLADLFITTSRENMTDPEPAAGAMFTVRPGVAGLSVRPYGG